MIEKNDSLILEKISNVSPHAVFIFVLLFICLSYSNTIYSPPVLDDWQTFIEETKVYVDDFSFASLKQLSSTRFGIGRFIPMLTFAADHRIGEGSIVPFHLTNIFIHILAACAVYFFLNVLCRTKVGRRSLSFLDPCTFSLFVTAIWALHPVQTNAVTYIVQRMASLAALFYFAALACYIVGRTGKSVLKKIIAWVCFFLFMVCALLSKENSVTLPLAVLMLEMFFIQPELGGKIAAKMRWTHWLALFVIGVALLPMAMDKMSTLESGYDIRHFSLSERLFTELRVVVFYLSLLIFPWPGRFNLEHDFPLSYSLWNPPTTFFALVFLAILVFAAFRVRRQHTIVSFGILLFFLNLVIESSVISLELVFEHRLYLPSLGFFMVVVALFDWGCKFISKTKRNETKAVLLLGMAIMSCALSVSTTFRNNVWRDKLTLYSDVISKSPDKPRAQLSYGNALAYEGRHEEALVVFEKVISLGRENYEDYLKAATSIINILVHKNKYEEAVVRAESFVMEMPENINWDSFPRLMSNLGVAYTKLGNFSESFEAFLLGASIKHRDTSCLLAGMEAMLQEALTDDEGRRQLGLEDKPDAIYIKIAGTLLEKKDYSRAREYLDKALAIDPYNNKTLEIKKRLDNEISLNSKVADVLDINKNPAYIDKFHFRLLLSFAGFIEKSYPPLKGLIGPLLEFAVRMEPDNPFATYKMGRWYLINSRVEDALRVAEISLGKNPEFPPLIELAAVCYNILEKEEKAVALYNELLAIYPGHPNWMKYKKNVQDFSEKEPMLNGSKS